MPESTRRQIGKYQIQAELGRGGFGVVYSAYDPTVGRPVAVKVLTAVGDNQLLTRFKNEAAAAGNLRHKNIVTIYDYGDDAGVPYIVMELLEGEDLNQIIAAGKPMSLLQKVSIMVQVADGLRSAHRAGVVHRDVKPGNIRLLPDGTVKLMDFGIARLVDGSAGTRLTRQGHVIGTLYYMAPEQVMGEEVDALSDIFAYGSTYYELLTGRHPFQGADPRSVFHKITAEDPQPIRNLVPDCPEALERIVSRTLQKDRDLRYQSLRDVQVDTEPILIELRQERAKSLVAEAGRLHSSGDLDAAQSVLGEVFDLDPANRDARLLRETIQSRLLKRLIGPKIEILVKKADDALSGRRYDDAIENLEAAVRLDRTDQVVAGRLGQARELLALSREVARLLANARRQFSKQDFEGALDLLLQVLERDHTNPEAPPLLDEVRTAITQRERERDFEEKIQQARQLLGANSFDEAAQLLGTLRPEFRDREEVTTLNAEIHSGKEAFERQQYLLREIAATRELLSAADFEGAISRVEFLMSRFPEEVELTRLFILAHRGLAASRKAQALDKLEVELKRQLDGHHFERALSLVSQSLKTYPQEPRLLESQRRIESEWESHTRELAIRQSLSEGERHSARKDYDKAVLVLEGAVQQFPGEERLINSLGIARDALTAKRREERILSCLGKAHAQLRGREFSAASETIDRALAEEGHDDRLTEFSRKVVSEKAAWQRSEAIRKIVENSRRLVDSGELEEALSLLRSGLEQFADEPQLLAARAYTQETLAARRREEAIARLLDQARALLGERRHQSALDALDGALTEYGQHPRVFELRAEVARAKAAWERAEAIRETVQQSQTFVIEGNFDGAIGLLEAALKRHGEDGELAGALASAQAAKRRELAIVELHRRATEQLQAGAYQDALHLLSLGLTEFDGDRRLADLHIEVDRAKQEWERLQAIKQAVAEARTLVERQAFEQAITLLESCIARFGEEAQLSDALKIARHGLEAKRRDTAIEAVVAQTRAQLERHSFDEALSLLSETRLQYGDDERLITSRDEVLAEKAKWERAEAIRELSDGARVAIAHGEFEKVIASLESGLERFGEDTGLREVLNEARAALARKRRNEGIEAATSRAQTQTDALDFIGALKTLDEAAASYGHDERVAARREEVLTAQAEWKRAETIRVATEDAQLNLEYGEPEDALALLNAALSQYPDASTLLNMRELAQQALAAKRREAGIVALQTQAEAQLKSGSFEEALLLLARGLAEFGGDARLAGLQKTAELAKASWLRAEAIRQLAEKSEQQVAKQEFEAALALLESALNEYPDEPQLLQAIHSARTALAAKQRDEAIEASLADVRLQLDQHDFPKALELVDRATGSFGSDRRLEAMRGDVSAAQARWEQAEAIRLLIEEAQRSMAREDFNTAITSLEAGVKRHGTEPRLSGALTAARNALAAKRRDEAVVSACKQAQTQTDRQDFTRAIKTLDRAVSAHGGDGRLAALRDRIVAAEAEWERARFVRLAIADGEKRLAQERPELAVQSLEAALKHYPADPLLTEALVTARNALELQRREEEIRLLLAQAESALQSRQWSVALDALNGGLNAYGSDRRISELREKALSAKAADERSEMLRRLVNDARSRMDSQQPEGALDLLESARSQFEGEPLFEEVSAAAREAVAAKQREQAIEAACRSAQSLLDERRYSRALEVLDAAAASNPIPGQKKGRPAKEQDGPLAGMRESIIAAKAEWERSEAIRQVLAESGGHIADNDLEGAMELLNRAVIRYPGASELVRALAAIREALQAAQKETDIAELSRETRLFIGMQDFPTALAVVDEALKVYGSETRLADLRENVLTARADWQRSEAIRKVISDAGNLVAGGSPDPACRLLETALSRFPGEPLLLEAHAKALEAANNNRREKFIAKVYSEVQAHFERGKYDLALQRLESALADYPRDRRLLELHQSALAAKAEAQRVAEAIASAVRSAGDLSERGEREEAIALLERALIEHPGHPELVGAIVKAIDVLGSAGTGAIDKICRNAREYMLTGNFDLAFHTIDQALRMQGDEQQQTGLAEPPQKTRTEAAKAAAAAAGAALHRDTGHGGASVKEVTGDLVLGDLREQPSTVPTLHQAPPQATMLFSGAFTDDTVAPPLQQPETERGKPTKWWLIGGCAALLLVALITIGTLRGPKLESLTIHTVPLGATVRLNDQVCSTPECQFRLKPGQYKLQVSADGYREHAETATVSAGSAPAAMRIALEPLSPTARVSANFAEGSVVLDNGAAGKIEEGQFTLDRISPGSHSLRISSREGSATLAFNTDYAKLPVLGNTSQQNTALIASASFGNRAVVTCTGCTGPVSIDGRPAGELKNGVITLENLAAGTHRVTVGSGRSLVLTATRAPGIDVAVTADRDYGALVVDAGEDDVAVYIDGNKYARLTSHGQLSIPAQAKAHTIRVAKEGYRVDPPEIHAQLAKGDQFQARFKLTPEPAHLLVSRQPAGADVVVDGSKLGVVGSNGSFSVQLPPGDHRVQFRKDGISSPQVQRSFLPGKHVTLGPSDAPLLAKAVTPPPVVTVTPTPLKPDPGAAEQTDWQHVAGTQTPSQLEDFLRRHPGGVHHDEAERRLKELQEQQAVAVREQAWKATDASSKASLEQFLSKYGEGSHAQDARTMIGAIETAQARAAKDAQRANEQDNHAATDTSAISDTLSQFQAAFNRRDLPALQAIWTGMPKVSAEIYRTEFRDAKSLDYRLTPAGQPIVNKESATIVCTRSQTFVAKNGQHPPATSERVRVTLARLGSQWVIRNISPLGAE